MDAQREAVAQHVAAAAGYLMVELIEVESGTKRDRPQLAASLAACGSHRAALVVAKLDRLAPNVAVVSALLESGVEFVAADMPTVKRLTVDILAAVAEEEARLISVRTKAARAAAKARGVQLGNPQLRAGTADQARAATAAKVDKARIRAADVLPFVRQAQAAGAMSLRQLANALTARAACRSTKPSRVQVIPGNLDRRRHADLREPVQRAANHVSARQEIPRVGELGRAYKTRWANCSHLMTHATQPHLGHSRRQNVGGLRLSYDSYKIHAS